MTMMCCRSGKIDLPLWLMPPVGSPAREILELWESDCELGKTLREFSRKITNALALGCMVITEPPPPPGRNGSAFMPTIVCQGRVLHKICGLTAQNSRDPHYAQQYVVDPDEMDIESVHNVRIGYMRLRQGTSAAKRASIHNVLQYIHERLEKCNRYVNDFKTAYEKARRGADFDDRKLVIRADAKPKDEHERRYNADTGMKEIAVLMSDDEFSKRDIVLNPKGSDQDAVYISETHRAYDSLHYTSLFPEGEDSWNLNMKLRGEDEEGEPWQDDFDDEALEEYDSQNDDIPYRTISQRQTDYYDRAAQRRGQVSCRDFYAFHLHDRPLHGDEAGRQGERDTLFYGGRAFQEYLVMAYAKMENQRLGFLSSPQGQTKLRAEQYDQLLEAIRDPTAGQVGRRVVLPSTYSGSPRDMNARYLDAMAIVRQYGKVRYIHTEICVICDNFNILGITIYVVY